MNYEIKLDVFQGPLDLLLHLIEKDEIDIYNIPIALITDKYLEYIHTIQLLNLEVVGDFLVMAATLMQIKAKMLLPQYDSEFDENIEEEDPRIELAQKLVEYKKIKEASLSLQTLELEQLRIYTRTGGEFADLKVALDHEPLKNLSIWDLMESFKTVLDSLESKPIKAVPKEDISIKQRMTEILDLVTQEGKVLFKTVFHDLTTKLALITCFLAILELIRIRKICAYQEELFGEITLSLSTKEA